MSIATGTGRVAVGGLDAAGYGLDTIVVVGGAGQKEVLAITWSIGLNGAALPTQTITTRLVVLDGGDYLGFGVSGAPRFSTAFASVAGAPLVEDGGGRTLFDLDLVANASQGIGGTFIFPDRATEGRLIATSGKLAIVLFAPRTAGNALVGLTGKLNIGYRNVYNDAELRDYSHAAVSRPMH